MHYDEVVNLIPSNIELSGMEVVLANTMSRETVLRTYLNEIKRQKLVQKARAFMRFYAITLGGEHQWQIEYQFDSFCKLVFVCEMKDCKK